MHIDNAEGVKKEFKNIQAEPLAVFNDTSDMNFFNAQLDLSAAPYKRIAPSSPDNLFNFSPSEEPFVRLKRGVNDTLRNKHTEASYALPQALGEANFAVVSKIKMLGLAVKSLDKISNMA